MTKNVKQAVDSKLALSAELKNLEGYRTISVSPSLAEKWLQLNPRNRPIQDANVSEYAKRMERKEWVLNGQPLIFSSDGLLLDGQHRLCAVVRHGKPVMFDVRFGVDPNHFSTLDDGSRRSAAHVFAIEDIPNAKNAASAIGFIYGLLAQNKSRHRSRDKRPSNQEMLEWYNDKPDFASFVQLGQKWYHVSNRLLSTANFAAYAYVFSIIDEKKAMRFFDQFAVGANLSTTSPIFHLRNRLLRSRFDPHNRLSPSTTRALIIKAFNFFLDGREVKVLKYDAEREKFPSLNLPEGE